MKCVLATSKDWNVSMKDRLERRTGYAFELVTKRDELNSEVLSAIDPRYIFFPHWSFLIPENIFTQFECVIFHMTDVPFGRGGTPLQNLIARGIYETKISALRCVKEIDAGPVYLKRDLSLHGNAEEIFLRAGRLIESMIVEIIKKGIRPQDQEGEVVHFQRRRPKQGDISNLKELNEVFDYIRMLDAKGYPKAFLKKGDFKFEFSRASLKDDHIVADVKISRKRSN